MAPLKVVQRVPLVPELEREVGWSVVAVAFLNLTLSIPATCGVVTPKTWRFEHFKLSVVSKMTVLQLSLAVIAVLAVLGVAVAQSSTEGADAGEEGGCYHAFSVVVDAARGRHPAAMLSGTSAVPSTVLAAAD